MHEGRTRLRDAVNQVVEEMRSDGSLEQALAEAGLPASATDVQAARSEPGDECPAHEHPRAFIS